MLQRIGLSSQPLGVFTGPASALILPGLADAEPASVALAASQLLEKIIAGAFLPAKEEAGLLDTPVFPAQWLFYLEAIKGNFDLALQALLAQEEWFVRSKQQWLLDYNKFVLSGDPVLLEKLSRELEIGQGRGVALNTSAGAGASDGAELEPDLERDLNSNAQLQMRLMALVKAVAYMQDLLPEPPAVPPSATGNIKAFLLSVKAHHELEQAGFASSAFEAGGDAAGEKLLRAGLDDLLAAAQAVEKESPVFAARLFGEWSASAQMMPQLNDLAIKYYGQALKLLEKTCFQELRAELALELGMTCQMFSLGRRDKLLAAINAYQQALLYFHREGPRPYNYGLAQMNLALVYLAMPMNDEAERLRPAIAVQSLREALKVFSKESEPKMWASASLNLANALQHVPSTHNETNLWEAVALYQEILELRQEGEDPLAYARVLANQGNALAHLGAFSRAEPTLERALAMFAREKETDSAEAVQLLLDEIKARRAEIGSL